jgi:hypothetical protein
MRFQMRLEHVQDNHPNSVEQIGPDHARSRVMLQGIPLPFPYRGLSFDYLVFDVGDCRASHCRGSHREVSPGFARPPLCSNAPARQLSSN